MKHIGNRAIILTTQQEVLDWIRSSSTHCITSTDEAEIKLFDQMCSDGILISADKTFRASEFMNPSYTYLEAK